MTFCGCRQTYDMTRNLIYHLYPAAGSVWLWNLRLMMDRLHLFDRVIVGVAEESGSVPPATISYYLRDHKNVEFVIARNDPKRGELTTLPAMLEMVKSDRQDEYTFYAHAKGVSHTGSRLEAVQNWTSTMWELNFNMAYVDNLLRTHACVGAFRRGGEDDPGFVGNKHGWHYSGNFWWAKHSELFRLPWRRHLRGRRHAAENFLGELFPVEMAGCVGPVGVFPLYSAKAWKPPHGRIYKALYST